jgi:peptidyl-prolyl cis-trans isomerase SurA
MLLKNNLLKGITLNKIKFILAGILIVLAGTIYPQQQEGDRIIAIIGNEVILESDLNYQLMLYARQNNLTQLDDRIIQEVFRNMVTEKLILAKADQDSITVSDEDVQKQLDYRIKSLIQQFGSEKNLEDAYGITVAKIKTILKDDIRKKMKVEKMKQKKFGYGIGVTRTEVQNFYKEYKDSIPEVPETFELYEIMRVPTLSQEAKSMAYDKAKQLLDSLKNGADFSELARKYSDDSASAVNGGDLGMVKKGVFVKPFEDAAFVLKPGEISDIVETEYGYHIIKVNERIGDMIKLQHILIKFPHLESADFDAINYLKDLKQKVLNGEATFQQLAYKYSQDEESAKDSGYIGKLNLNSLADSSEANKIKYLNAGEISDPIKLGDNTNYSYNIFYVKDRVPEHKPTLETDYQLIESYAQHYKENKELADWIDELKKSIYVEIKM